MTFFVLERALLSDRYSDRCERACSDRADTDGYYLHQSVAYATGLGIEARAGGRGVGWFGHACGWARKQFTMRLAVRCGWAVGVAGLRWVSGSFGSFFFSGELTVLQNTDPVFFRKQLPNASNFGLWPRRSSDGDDGRARSTDNRGVDSRSIDGSPKHSRDTQCRQEKELWRAHPHRCRDGRRGDRARAAGPPRSASCAYHLSLGAPTSVVLLRSAAMWCSVSRE